MDRDARIAELLDKQEITECILRFARGVDRHDAELARSVYHDGARDDHAMFVGSGEELVEWADELHDQLFRGHQHYVSNVLIELEGDQAHAESYVIRVAGKKDSHEHALGGGRYLDRLERRDGEWRIVDRVLVIEWDDEYEAIAGLSLAFSQDRGDPSYARPLRVERAPGSRLGNPDAEVKA
jgi:SnoaL-like protein